MSAAAEWFHARSYAHSDFSETRLLAERECSISVCLPAREEAATIGPIVAELVGLRERGVIDEVVVVDAASQDGTGGIAAALGADVYQQPALMPGFGEVQGKGDALWRALSVLRGDIVCFLDADSEDFGGHFARGLIGPLVCERGVEFVKGCYRRPFKVGEVQMPDGGGRVTELTARPLLNLFYPELAGFRQPLAGEFAARRELLERLPFACGYSVEIGMLIDAYREVGLAALAQVDLGSRQNRHQPLAALGAMSYAVLTAVTDRLQREGRLVGTDPGEFLMPRAGDVESRTIELVQRPPMASLGDPLAPSA